MPIHSPQGFGRNLLNHGAGKGDKARHQFNQKYRDNFDAIDWTAIDPMFDNQVRPGVSRYRKVYKP